MIIPKEHKLTDIQISELQNILQEFNCSMQVVNGASRSIYAILGDERNELMINRIEGLDYISHVDTIQSPFKLMDIKAELSNHKIKISNKLLEMR